MKASAGSKYHKNQMKRNDELEGKIVKLVALVRFIRDVSSIIDRLIAGRGGCSERSYREDCKSGAIGRASECHGPSPSAAGHRIVPSSNIW